jgi:transposase
MTMRPSVLGATWTPASSRRFFMPGCPRVECPTHGVKQVKVSWAEEHSRFTALFERLAIMVLKEANVEGAGKILRISWDEAWQIMGRAVERGRKRKKRRVVKKMGVDEKSLGKGHNYLTLVYDLEAATVEHIEDDRRKESLRDFWSYRSPARALNHFKAWYAWAIRSRLKPIKEVARMFRKYWVNILTFLKHRITNAVSEGLNSTIQTIKKMARGFRNREHFKTAIYFHCGGLNLYPVTRKNGG